MARVPKALTARQIGKIRGPLRANQAAQGQGLFSASRDTRKQWDIAMGKKSRAATPDDIRRHHESNLKHQDRAKAQRAQLAETMDARRAAGASPAEMQAYQKQYKDAWRQERELRSATNGYTPPAANPYTASERLAAGGRAAGSYFFGGTGAQTAARVGGVGAGIVGINMAGDYMNSRTQQ